MILNYYLSPGAPPPEAFAPGEGSGKGPGEGSGEGPAERRLFFFLHGFLGSGLNWRGIARRFEPEFFTVCPDARNHGHSPHASGTSYPSMAADLFDTAESLGRRSFLVLGHSMGGKTAMEAALSRPDLVEALMVADIAPAGYPPPVQHRDYLGTLAGLDLSGLVTRKDAMEALEAAIPDRTFRSFFLANLERDGGGRFSWRINLPGLLADYDKIWEGIAPGRTYQGPALFIRGGDSDYIEDKDEPAIRELFPRAEFAVIPGAGHWVQNDRPRELTACVGDFLKRHHLAEVIYENL